MMKQIRLIVFICLMLMVNTVYAQDTPDTTCEAGFIPLTDATGVVCIPENIERVVALEWKYVEDVLSLGLQPVGVADIEGYNAWVKIPVTLDESVLDVGTRQEPNLELIASLDPDLIIVAQFRAAENYDELSAIAPVLAFNPYPAEGSHYDEMIATFKTIATALNREAEAEQVLADMEAHFVTATNALVEAGKGGEGFILSQVYIQSEAATFRLFTDNAMAVQILSKIGLSNAWDDANGQYGFSTIGIEGFATVGDTNFLFVAQEDDRNFFYESALWGALPFVQNNHAYWIGADIWLFGGPLSAVELVNITLSALGVELPAEASTVSYTHQFGTTDIPANPQRIVAADLGVFIPTF
ncbi:MAG TPA: ABC transporter substrate-binding protein, partial [Aggregatilineales bacterium]|nr:ABC transporter substrate-binding protein [Aggregatilineales bacterium]